MSIAEPTVDQFPHPALAYVAATRPPFITATVMPVLMGLAYAAFSGFAINWLNAALTLLAGILLHAAINVLNDYYDALNGTDAANDERIFPFTGGSRFIQNEVLTPRQTLQFGLVLLLSAIAIGLYLITQSGMTLFWLGLFGVVLGWGYSSSLLRLNSRGLGELAVLLGFGLLPMGAYYVQSGQLSLAMALISLPVGLLTTNLLYINQFPDRKADIQAHKLHWVARLEPRTARWGYVIIAVAAWSMLPVLVFLGILPLAALITLLPALLSYRAAGILLRHASHPSLLAPAIQLTILAMLSHGALLAMVLAGYAALSG